jgi:hypothetical protein
VGCGDDGAGAHAPSIAAPASFKGSYFGTSATDVWAFYPGSSSGAFALQHWDGATWTDVAALAHIQRASSACVAGPGKAWIAGDLVLGVVDAAGSLSDLTAQAPVAPPSAFRSLQCGHGVALLSAGQNSGGSSDTAKLYLWDGTKFGEIASPDGSGKVGPSTVFAANDIFTVGALPLALPDYGRDTAGPDYHYDGSKWTRGTANGSLLGVAGASPNFPRDDVWAGCGGNAVRFDGAVLWPIPAPSPASASCRFGYHSGRPFMVFSAAASPGEVPTAYSVDQDGNYTLLDVAGTGSLTYRRNEWDGQQWTGGSQVAVVKSCIGPGCGYNGGGPSSGFAGELDDGTLVLQASDGGNNQIYLAR